MKFNDKKRTVILSILLTSTVFGTVFLIILIAWLLSEQQHTANTETSLPPSPIASVLPVNFSENIDTSELTYKISTPPNLIKSEKLQAIVNKIIKLVKKNKLPTQSLSIAIINLETGGYAGYQSKKLRYPASVVKLFWMVYLYAQIEKGILSEAEFTPYLDSMIKKSDNGASSYILDKITKTESKQNIKAEEYQKWRQKRLKVNQYFRNAGYDKINVSQKTFPIPSLKLLSAKGADLKLRDNPQKPIRNQVSTLQAARLLYEIYNHQSVSEIYSKKMAKLLIIDSETRNIRSSDRNANGFNPVRGFLSENLPADVHFSGKAGSTSDCRNDAAIIATDDAAYILVVFGEDKAYSDDLKIFPSISKLVFNSMTN